MNNKNTGMIATIATVVLCGCPGLFMCLFGAGSTIAGIIPGSNIDINGNSSPSAAIATGIGTLCLSLIFIAIPIAVGFFMLRKKPEAVAATVVEVPANDEPLPPAS